MVRSWRSCGRDNLPRSGGDPGSTEHVRALVKGDRAADGAAPEAAAEQAAAFENRRQKRWICGRSGDQAEAL